MIKQVMDLYEVMDNPKVRAEDVIELFKREDSNVAYQIEKVSGIKGTTEFVRITIPGLRGKIMAQSEMQPQEGTAPTLGITGTLGGIGARPQMIGFVSDGDGALAALAAGLKLVRMSRLGDQLDSDVIVTTHICPDAPTVSHFPVPFMDSAVSDMEINQHCVCQEMDGILSVDTTKGNQVINTNGFAISNTVKSGYILSVSQDLMEIMKRTTGRMPYVFPLAQQDITPYGNELDHLNSILQPSVATEAPVVGVAITSEVITAGCATGATRFVDVEGTARFLVEVAKEFSKNPNLLYREEEYQQLVKLYGSMERYQTGGNAKKKRVGIVAMGQVDSDEKYSDMRQILAPEADMTAVGIVDGLTYEEIQKKYWPRANESFLVSTIQGGKVIKIAEHHAQQLIQEKVRELEERGIMANMIVCTAAFQEVKKEGILIQPSKVIDSMLKVLGIKRIGIILPEKEQIEEAYDQYKQYDPVIRAASPYGSREAIMETARQFADENLEIILTDCMGFTKELGDLIAEQSGKSVVIPRVLISHILKALI